jgi:hypothetical protein
MFVLPNPSDLDCVAIVSQYLGLDKESLIEYIEQKGLDYVDYC